nr:MAG TPA: hypothetical protein [Caudoviricetes sp.]
MSKTSSLGIIRCKIHDESVSKGILCSHYSITCHKLFLFIFTLFIYYKFIIIF